MKCRYLKCRRRVYKMVERRHHNMKRVMDKQQTSALTMAKVRATRILRKSMKIYYADFSSTQVLFSFTFFSSLFLHKNLNEPNAKYFQTIFFPCDYITFFSFFFFDKYLSFLLLSCASSPLFIKWKTEK